MPFIFVILGGVFIGLQGAGAASSVDYTGMGLSAMEAEQMANLTTSPILGVVSVLIAVISAVAGLFIKALILWGMFAIFRGRGKFSAVLSVAGFSYFPLMIRDLLQLLFANGGTETLSAAISGIRDMTYGGMLFDMLKGEGIVFLIWSIVIMAIGFAAVLKNVSLRKAAVLCVVFYAGHFLITAGISYASVKASMDALNMLQ